ncbi:MAG: asparaginase [Chloroflexota bacterium]|nr:asparaginase [Chloroflexota bacterium]
MSTAPGGDRHPRLLLVTTGGTIASRRDPVTGAVAAGATGEELLARVPEIAAWADVETVPIASVNGWNVTPELMLRVATAIEDGFGQGAAGAIVTHGTDTVEETATLLDLVLTGPEPVAFAVALRHLDDPASDGPGNLRDAVRVVLSPGAWGRGPLVVEAGAIHAARWVTKGHTTRPGAFVSPGHGPMGSVVGGAVTFPHPAPPRPPVWEIAPPSPVGSVVTTPAVAFDDRVLLLKPGAGEDDRQIRWAIEAGYRGIVIEGTGAGNVPGTMVPAIEAAIGRGIAVVLATRVPEGNLAMAYGGGGARGGGHDLASLGVIPAHGLIGPKARIVTMVALGAGGGIEGVRGVFSRYRGEEVG